MSNYHFSIIPPADVQGRAMVDAMGNFTFTLPRDLTPGMHMASAAPVDAMGTTGTPGSSNTFTVPECATDAECDPSLRCDTVQGACVARSGDGGMTGDASADASTDGGMTGDDAGMDGGVTEDGSSMMADGSVVRDGSAMGGDGSSMGGDARGAEGGGLSILSLIHI